MCTTFFKIYKSNSKGLRFVVAFNRDEDPNRKSKMLGWHPDFANILCGIDVQTGTSWLAINISTGDFAMLTNNRIVKADEKQAYTSRGNLIMEFVKIRDETI